MNVELINNTHSVTIMISFILMCIIRVNDEGAGSFVLSSTAGLDILIKNLLYCKTFFLGSFPPNEALELSKTLF